MARKINVIALSGSLRRESFNTRLLEAARELAPPGMLIDGFSLRDIPLFSQDTEQQPVAAVVDLKRRIRAADAVLFATPEYNYSFSGVLKNAIDQASRPYGDSAWAGKPCAIMGASSGGGGTMRAQYHLRQVLVYLDMYTLNHPEVFVKNAGEMFEGAGPLKDDATRKQIRTQLEALAKLVEMVRGAGDLSAAA